MSSTLANIPSVRMAGFTKREREREREREKKKKKKKKHAITSV